MCGETNRSHHRERQRLLERKEEAGHILKVYPPPSSNMVYLYSLEQLLSFPFQLFFFFFKMVQKNVLLCFNMKAFCRNKWLIVKKKQKKTKL